MSDNIPDTVEASGENTVFIQPQTDLLNAFMSVPVTKLDADQYVVTDLDGVTEGLFASGNMNFLMMQAGQTDDAIQSGNLFDTVGGDDSTASVYSPAAGIVHASPTSNDFGTGTGGNHAVDGAAGFQGAPDSFTGPRSAAASGHSAASAPAANTQSTNAFSSVQNFSGGDDTITTSTNTPVNGANGNDGTSGSDGSDGAPGVDGQDGTGGGDGGDTTIINVDVDIDNNFGGLTEIVENVTNTTTDIVTNITNNVFDTINNILDGTPLGPIGLNLNLALDDLTHLNLDILHGNDLFNAINQTIDLSQITTPVTDLLGDLTAGLDLGVLIDPFHFDSSATDTDLHVTTDLNALGIPLLPDLDIDIPLDLVEALVGDLDINLNVADDLLNLLGQGDNGDTDIGLDFGGQLADLPLLGDATDILLNPVEDLVGDIDLGIVPSLNLFGDSETSNAAGDTDISIPLNIELLGHDILAHTLEIPLDPIESITGDIDLDLGLATNLLGNTAANLFDAIDGGSSGSNLLSDVGDQLSGIADTLLPDGNPLDLLSNPDSLVDFASDIFEVNSDIPGTSTSLLDSILTPIGNTLDTALDVLSNATDNGGGLNLDILSGNPLDFPMWTDSILPDAGSALGGGLGADLAQLIPDPIDIGSIVPTITHLIPDSLGNGLGGIKHFGGLFG